MTTVTETPLTNETPPPLPAANVRQGLTALYTLQDMLRLRGRGYPCTPEWIKHYNVIGGLTSANRKNVLRLSRMPCLRCLTPMKDDSSGDHVIPLESGGPAGIENYIPLCGKCNSSKGKKDLLEWWLGIGESFLSLPPDALCVYSRLAFAHYKRLDSLNDPANQALERAINELAAELLDQAQLRMLRLRVSWIWGQLW